MAYLDMDGLTHYDGLIKAEISGKIDVGSKAGGIPYGNVDSTSTSTKFTATVEGLTELYDGACVMLHNGVVTSAKNFTINVNGLGAKKCYSNLTNATQETTIFNANYTLMFVYSTALDGGNGGWWCYHGYDSNTTYTPVKLGFGYGHCTTAAATAAKAVAISGYVLNTGGIVSVLFDHDVQAGATLNVTSKGAKAIYYKGAAIANGIIKAGDTATFMYSTQYHLLSIDRWGSDIDGKQPTLVSGTNIKTINGESILGSGNIATPTYTLPEATTSTLGGVKVDGTTITATDGVISAVGGGGGGGYDLVINVTLNDGGTAVVSHDADFLECMSFARAFASGQDVRAVAYCRYASYDDEDDIYAAGADALPLVYADTQSYGGGQYETDGGWSLTFIAVASITQRTVSGNKVSYVNARQLVVRASNDDPELGVSVDYSVL